MFLHLVFFYGDKVHKNIKNKNICSTHSKFFSYIYIFAGRSGLVVTHLPAAREGPGSNRTADKSFCFHVNHGDTQLLARAAH